MPAWFLFVLKMNFIENLPGRCMELILLLLEQNSPEGGGDNPTAELKNRGIPRNPPGEGVLPSGWGETAGLESGVSCQHQSCRPHDWSRDPDGTKSCAHSPSLAAFCICTARCGSGAPPSPVDHGERLKPQTQEPHSGSQQSQ